MSGHSKWATIKHKKGAADAKRGQMFTKLIKEISIAARMGGGDPDSNARLRTAMLKARAANMPKDNIERAIKKGTGELGGATFEELVYEAYAPGGVAILIEVLTDNKNRAAAEVRNILNKAGGSLATANAVVRLFERKGVISLDGEKYSEETVMELALEAGADDIANEDGEIVVYTTPDAFETVLNAINAKDMATDGAEISMVPATWVDVDADTGAKISRMIDRLEENDDVQNVYHNANLPETDE
ncbi:MAG: transcriptional regulator [Spirochaetes bacterium GWD1_61_31]|nr:MAG: transcriptional regulator [Spirochaetes bacterium GWB1_60_80]OHD32687.1 MAG: transcriptional regulator [Spirochaetes bacterium GWC1_61_12]OHD42070.1 MAG: transcriptional regulator [Spirochaetes bacterium GWE1_60_18]OHD43359.1 MAG: transcriptional regulator [Spirochaetes bacterium GWD1_61_31]OHD60996.1 MAG: transcriptional regulator [Spirochaetes bacterium GWF1_60_12]HAP43234.1 YebC/PmpR family DNA-binding transcriptional regulator [Spirochaetaceae bacterium]